ncbi:phosphoribosylformylglycinamidine synthase [candidate division WOR-1 bacterium RIFCSPHIGHO2_01_FULL_53_15]|uniref:Phosphoribosylformylglycinamidine synthase subunit PurS n=1 Tax=candidate division WOR-1 bacterium RIFCSPHIGHO2_01_FULL_53_15 TaxID=1802564 RepID=A0A1F4PZM1_UNCSA|nr:MAG: phosphoribosylformylglycinamidine synthase [candidate division WOR-1 bacterium RIFCSPHIGHO2_01_FULL_53_15]OGC10783.1 MAG: phosphoribosylformylglycinamidine synthase [candidate division WOR-1 bacterium RIFCSPHIGHO2_02_FULL_53_26]
MAKVNIYVTPKKGILDPQGKAVESALHSLGYKNVGNVRIGKFIKLEIKGSSPKGQEKQIKEMCNKLLTNPIIEDYRYETAD